MSAFERFKQRMAAWSERAGRVRRGPAPKPRKPAAAPLSPVRVPEPVREPLTVEQRFWAKVDRRGPDDCWLWAASLNNWGYGRFRLNGRARSAHVIAWTLARGDIPAGLFVLHNCPSGDNPACVNPGHLWLGTHQDNMDDMARKGRRYRGDTATTPAERDDTKGG